MTKELAVKENNFAMIEQVVIKGDLSKLSDEDRVKYYKSVCESLNLNPLTKPFDYILLNGKLTLYATKNCTEQLRKLNGVSIEDLDDKIVDDLYIVKAKARDKHGRTDESTGAVNIGNLKGEAKANAIMKAETKAKRRVTLSISGLGWCDETEVDSIPDAKKVPVNMETGEITINMEECEDSTQKPNPLCVNSSYPNDKINKQQHEQLLELTRQIDENCKANMEAYLLKEYQISNYEDIPVKAFDMCMRAMKKNIDLNNRKKQGT